MPHWVFNSGHSTLGIVSTSVRGLKKQAGDTEVTEVITAGKSCHPLCWEQKMLRVSEPKLLEEEPQELGVRPVRSSCCLLFVGLLFVHKDAGDQNQCCWESTGPWWDDPERKKNTQEEQMLSPLPLPSSTPIDKPNGASGQRR